MAGMQRSDWLTSMKSTHRRFGPSSLSCKDVVVNGEDRKIMIINSDDFDLKYAHCIFDDFLIVGSYIEWNDETWIVTKEGGQKDVSPSYELQKCNYELKWVKDGETITKKAYASDMTYSQVGVQHTDYMVYGDSRSSFQKMMTLLRSVVVIDSTSTMVTARTTTLFMKQQRSIELPVCTMATVFTL